MSSTNSESVTVVAANGGSNFETRKSVEARTDEILREIETMGDGSDVAMAAFKRDAAHRFECLQFTNVYKHSVHIYLFTFCINSFNYTKRSYVTVT